MTKNLKIFIILLPLLFTAFTPGERGNIVEYFHSFKTLKDAGAPREMKIINTDNIGKGKSAVESGVLITYKNWKAKDVKIAGDFSFWDSINMSRSNYGVWYAFLTKLNKTKVTRYKLIVDGTWTSDPMNIEKEDDGLGSYVSVIEPFFHTDKEKLTYRIIGRDQVEFRIYKPNAKFVSIVGDFNNWNPENDLLSKRKNGVWSLKKKLSPGIYKYKYIIDDNWSVDLYNPKTAGDLAGGICSLIKIEK